MSVETIIIGGGQAGLALSYYLTQQGHPHAILEQAAQAANPWRNERWDSFTFVTPNGLSHLPGMDHEGTDPDGYLPRAQIVAYFEEYIRRFNLPIRFGVRVTAVEASDAGYRVTTDGETLEAANVVVATGLFQHPRVPAFSQSLPPRIVQLHSSQYRNPTSLPPGAVLVVGSGQSGCQIMEELHQSGRKVYLSLGSTGRAPRRYRGTDVFEWLRRVGFFDRTAAMLPSPKAKFMSAPQISGAHGGHTINVHQFARDGIVLLGHIRGVEGEKLIFTADLKACLAKIDKFEADVVQMIDGFIEKTGMNLPTESLPQLRDGYEVEEITELNLKDAGITSVIWATGYGFDFSIVRLPMFDEDGFPVTQRGVAAYPGLYFVGLPFIDKMKSGFLLGVGEHAAYIAEQITGRAVT